jgi:type IX secretion system PorP/SprF family membrane protein
MFNMMAINPGYTGSRDVLSATALYRRQWWGVDGAPITMTLSADMPIIKEKLGIGLLFSDDRVGKIGTTNASGFVAYRVKIHKKGTLAMGANIGASFYNTDFQNIALTQEGNNGTDLSFRPYASTQPLVGAGLYYSTDKFYIGLSAPNLLSYNLVRVTETQSQGKKFQHIFLMAGYVFNLSENIKLKPSFLMKYVYGAPMQWDVNANLWLYDRFGIGLSVRTDASKKIFSAVAVLLEFQATENIRIGYAYDYPFNNTYKLSFQTHELMLRYELGFRSRKMVSPRFF